MIELRDVRKRFGAVHALAGVSFAAADGRVTGLLGPNGAGKSTALRILCTVLRADAGAARVDGIEVGDDPIAVRGRIGVLPHNANLYPNLTARENIAYFAALHGMRGGEAATAVRKAMTLLDIDDLAERRAKGFSQGQRIRVALARAMVHDPATLILDEPTNGLDVMATRALREVIRERRNAGCCVLFSSHVMQEVAAVCDHIAIIAGGRVAAEGTADQIRAAAGCADLEDAFVASVAKVEQAHGDQP